MRVVYDLRHYLQLLRGEFQLTRHLVENLVTPVRSELLVRSMDRPDMGGKATHQRPQQEYDDSENGCVTAYLSVFHDLFPPSSVEFRRDFRVDCPHRRRDRAVVGYAFGPGSPATPDAA